MIFSSSISILLNNVRFWSQRHQSSLLQSVTRRDFVHVTILIELADQARVDQLFDFDVCRFGTLHGHEPANIAQSFERWKWFALDAHQKILITLVGDGR